MKRTYLRFCECDIEVKYPDDAEKKAWSKYSFHFQIDGASCRYWYDQKTDDMRLEGSEKALNLYKITRKVEKLIKEAASTLDLGVIDVRKFLCKHIEARIKVDRVFDRVPMSQRRHVTVGAAKPIDIKSLPLEQQCLAELLAEQLERGEKEGRPTNGLEVSVTQKMMKTRLEEKKKQQSK
jgi:hypothetical protein